MNPIPFGRFRDIYPCGEPRMNDNIIPEVVPLGLREKSDTYEKNAHASFGIATIARNQETKDRMD